MAQIIFVIYGLILFINALFEKWGWWEKLALIGSVAKIKTFYELTQCRFCLLFHISWIITLIYGILFGLKWELLLVPFVVSGLTTLKK